MDLQKSLNLARAQLASVLRSRAFARSENQKRLLRYIVEHSTRRIDVTDGCYLLSETYDRTGENPSAVGDEIAAAVVTALRLKFSTYFTEQRRLVA